MSIENQTKDLLALDPGMKLFVDAGVSGEVNLTRQDGAWSELWAEFMQDPEGCEICVVAFDRVGRKQGKVLSTVEDIIDLGGSLYVVHDERRYDKASDDVAQDVALVFQSFSNSQYRKEVSRKTQRAIDGLQAAGVKLGPKPKFGAKEVAQMKELHQRGLGLVSIGKVVRVARKDGSFVNTSPRVVRRVISGEYVTREEWERCNQIARLSMVGGGSHGE